MSSAIPRRIRVKGPLTIVVLCFIGLVAIPSIFFFNPRTSFPSSQEQQYSKSGSLLSNDAGNIIVDPSLSEGGVIMPHLGNATAKAELGRATWKLIHTMTARYPVKPKPEERAAVKQWIYLLSRLYPCGECAEHFQEMLKKHPPQTSSRASLSNWACSVHNIVNDRLGKPEFDCSTLADVYKCGCADEPTEGEAEGISGSNIVQDIDAFAGLDDAILDRQTLDDRNKNEVTE